MSDISQPPFPDHLSGVIFDLDGTLARTSDLIFASFNHVSEKYLKKKLSPAEIIALFGPPEDGGLRRLLGREDVEDAMDDLCTYYEENHGEMAVVHPGIEDVLTFLSENNVQMAIFTGKGVRTTNITLRALGIDSYFNPIVTGSDVDRPKPSPDGIYHAMEALALKPNEVLMVGDSLSDIKASRAAGVRIASVMWDSYDRESLLREPVEYRFDEVDHFRRWLGSHFHDA